MFKYFLVYHTHTHTYTHCDFIQVTAGLFQVSSVKLFAIQRARNLEGLSWLENDSVGYACLYVINIHTREEMSYSLCIVYHNARITSLDREREREKRVYPVYLRTCAGNYLRNVFQLCNFSLSLTISLYFSLSRRIESCF